MTTLFSAAPLAADRIAALKARLSRDGLEPKALVFLNGANAGMRAYGARLQGLAGSAGVALAFSGYGATPEAVYAQLEATGDDIDAVLTLYPLPDGVDPIRVAAIVGPDRDADGLNPQNAGLTVLGRPRRVPATANAVLAIAEHLAGALAGRHVVLVGASRIVGRPLAELLMDREATVTVTQAATRDLGLHTRQADILVTAAGQPGLIGADHIRPGAIIIDVAVNRTEAGLVGDVDQPAVTGIAAVVTQVPDGVGPLTTAFLFENIADAALQRERDRTTAAFRLKD